jgi:tetratricopeptide (TPR) repeat protein
VSDPDQPRLTVPTTSTDVGHAATTPVDAVNATTAPDGAAIDAPADDPLIGTSIGRYRLVARVGAGGMGVVYRALDPALDRIVAVKLLPPLAAAARANLEDRLRREAQALARVDHPHVVAVYDVGETATNLFVAMQFVDGTTLDRHLVEHPLGARAIVALFVAAGRGLAAAHAVDIVHRDVKPSNILVDRAGHAYIGDFGLARTAGELEQAASVSGDDLLGGELTRAGAILGTPLFMAPEQHRGEPATPRSDQYSFCLSVWHGLFGRHPFATGRWQRASVLAAMEADRVIDPPRPKKVAPRVVRALRRGLRHDPAARWPSMSALLAALAPPARTGWVLAGLTGAGLMGGAVVMMLVSSVGEDRDPCAGAAAPLAAIATAERARLLPDGFGATGLGYAPALATRVQAALGDYGARWAAMRIDTCRANRVRHDQSDDLFDRRIACLDQRLAALDSALAVLTAHPTAEIVDHAVEVVRALPSLDECADLTHLSALVPEPSDPARRVAIARTSGAIERVDADLRAGVLAGTPARADQLIVDAKATGWAPLTLRAETSAANARTWSGEFDAAIDHYRAAAVEAGRAHDDRAASAALAEAARLLADHGKPAATLVMLDDAEVVLQRAGDPPMPRGQLECARGMALGNLSRFPEAKAAFVRALAATRAAPIRDDLALARMLLDEAGILKRANEVAPARAAVLEAQSIYLGLYGPDHPQMAAVHQLLGNLAYQDKDITAGKAEYARYIAILRGRFADDHILIAVAHFDQGTIALHQDRLDDAATEFADAYARLRRLGPAQPNTFSALYMLGTTRMLQGKLDDALAAFQQVLDFRLAKLGDGNVATADVIDAMGEIYLSQNDLTRAFAAKRRALAIREKALGADNPDVADSLQGLAELALTRDDCAEATALAARAVAILDHPGIPPGQRVGALTILATCAVKAGQLSAGVAQFAQLRALLDAPGGADVIQRADVRTTFADALWARGQHGPARALYLEARALYAAARRPDDVALIQRWLDAHRAR